MITHAPPWVLVDLSYLAYRAMNTVGHLQHGELKTGVMFGFFNQLRMICQDPKVQSNKVGIFIDSRHSVREEFYPDYKKKRKQERTPEDIKRLSIMWQQIRVLVKEVLPAVGIPTYRQKGLESDDLMAMAAVRLKTFDGGAVVIVTGDGDLYQCINNRVSWYDPGRRKFYNEATFRAEKGIAAKLWGQVKALAGCHSDNVKGIPGIGEATAIKYLTGTLPMHQKAYQKIRVASDIKLRNQKLVLLPHHLTKPFQIREPSYNPDAFFKFAKKYGLISFTKDRDRWLSFFAGRKPVLKLTKIGEKHGKA